MHVDTGHNFPEVIDFRDRRVAELGARLIVAVACRTTIDAGRVVEETGPRASRNRLQTDDAARRHRASTGSTPCFGGARRDEEKARAKERVFSLPRRVRPVGPEEPAPRAVEPLQRPASRRASTSASSRSRNWTELDIWQYIAARSIELPSIYFAHQREVFERDGMLLAVSDRSSRCWTDEEPFETTVRYRTVGDMTLHRRGRVDGRDGRRHHRRGRRHPDHRARRDPRRRPLQRGRHGRPQARGLLLMATRGAEPARAAALRHGRLGRRRQVAR